MQRLTRNGQMLGAMRTVAQAYSLYAEQRTADATTQMAVYRQSSIQEISQVNKGIRWMPRRQEPKKDAVSCEKSRRAASRH